MFLTLHLWRKRHTFKLMLSFIPLCQKKTTYKHIDVKHKTNVWCELAHQWLWKHHATILKTWCKKHLGLQHFDWRGAGGNIRKMGTFYKYLEDCGCNGNALWTSIRVRLGSHSEISVCIGFHCSVTSRVASMPADLQEMIYTWSTL